MKKLLIYHAPDAAYCELPVCSILCYSGEANGEDYTEQQFPWPNP